MPRYYVRTRLGAEMGKKRDISEQEKLLMVQKRDEGLSVKEIATELRRDPRTIHKYLKNINHVRKPRKKSEKNVLNDRVTSRIKREAIKNPLSSSKSIFEACGVGHISRSSRCRVMRKLGVVKKAVITPPLNKKHKEKRVAWAETYLKTDFSKVIFTDECRATLDGPDGWAHGWVVRGQKTPSRIRRQQGGGGVMFWAAIVDKDIIGPFRVPDGVKIDSSGYCDLLQRCFIPWWKRKAAKTRKSLIFMHDNAPAHASKFTQEWLSKQGIKEQNLMVWPPCSPDLNPIENVWSVIKQEIYKGGKQFSSKDELWKAIEASTRIIKPEMIRRLTKSVDTRLSKVLQGQGRHVGH